MRRNNVVEHSPQIKTYFRRFGMGYESLSSAPLSRHFCVSCGNAKRSDTEFDDSFDDSAGRSSMRGIGAVRGAAFSPKGGTPNPSVG
jgi:hypothetical protein